VREESVSVCVCEREREREEEREMESSVGSGLSVFWAVTGLSLIAVVSGLRLRSGQWGESAVGSGYKWIPEGEGKRRWYWGSCRIPAWGSMAKRKGAKKAVTCTIILKSWMGILNTEQRGSVIALEDEARPRTNWWR
jgi:hypothetical protein